MSAHESVADVLGDALDGYGDPDQWAGTILAVVSQPDVLRDLIRYARPAPVADENGDVHCQRLWPVAECQWLAGHYGGCAT